MSPEAATGPGKAASGIVGLDDILLGGFARDRVYLLEGHPGTGKTTIALQFLMTGAKAGQRALYITLSESERELREGAASHGWTLDGIEIFEVVPPESLLDADQQQSLLYSSDLELGETTKLVFEAIERIQPDLLVFDSLSEVRLLAQSSLRYRRQILALKHYFARHHVTVLMLDDLTGESGDQTVHSVAHGVVRLEELAPEYGAQRRRLRVLKYRGQKFRGGFHDFTIQTGGVAVFPRLIAAEHHQGFVRDLARSGIAGLDSLLGGGVERGSSVLLLGPSGSGKSLVTLAFVTAAIARGERAAMFVFDEELNLLIERARQMGFDLEAMQANGNLVLAAIDAAEVSPGEFAHRMRAVIDRGVSMVVIDSVNGYTAAMPHERFVVAHLHELLQFLNRRGIYTFVTVAQHGLVGDMSAPIDITYLADTVVLLRYFEAAGRVRRAISVIKKRFGSHEDTIREMQVTNAGIVMGNPLQQFSGVLRGVPVFTGGPAATAATGTE